MSDDVVIRAERLGKKYVIGHQSSERSTTLRDVIVRTAENFTRGAAELMRGKPIYAGDELEEFWALKDVSFEIKRGDVVGIIGRNGAGKSTLLKVLSRITEPTEGRVEIKGRAASLLEVGTGFHPELSGRENIYLNGAILGMTRAEIRRKFDEIVDFSGVEKFLDTPVKRYSSGMYVRLAFSVAAHLEPEILIVDEVLAVGDAEFQKKCLGKMRDVAGHGRTIIFVSHNIEAIESICRSAIVMNSGKIETIAPVTTAIGRYFEGLKRNSGINECRSPAHKEAPELISIDWAKGPCGTVKFIDISVCPRDGSPRDLAIVIEDSRQSPLFTSHLSDKSPFIEGPQKRVFRIELPTQNIRSGTYHVSFASFSPQRDRFFDIVLNYPMPELINLESLSTTDLRWGTLFFPLNWRER